MNAKNKITAAPAIIRPIKLGFSELGVEVGWRVCALAVKNIVDKQRQRAKAAIGFFIFPTKIVVVMNRLKALWFKRLLDRIQAHLGTAIGGINCLVPLAFGVFNSCLTWESYAVHAGF